MFWFIESKIDQSAVNTADVAVHRYFDGQFYSFGQGMSVCGFGVPEQEKARMRLLEPNIDDTVRNLTSDATQRIPPPLLQALLTHRFDVTVLLNSSGGGVSLQRMFSRYADSVAASGGIETVAPALACSAGLALFEQGKRRLAYPTTQFMIHRPGTHTGFEALASRFQVTVDAVRAQYDAWVRDVADPIYDRILQSISEPKRNAMAALFEAGKDDLSHERKVFFSGANAPGFVTEYLDEITPLHSQLSERYELNVDPQRFHQDPFARFVVTSEVDRRLQSHPQTRQLGIHMFLDQGRWRMQGGNGNLGQEQLLAVRPIITGVLEQVLSEYRIPFERR